MQEIPRAEETTKTLHEAKLQSKLDGEANQSTVRKLIDKIVQDGYIKSSGSKKLGSINYSCSNDSSAVQAPSPSPPTNISILDPCTSAYCGGGTCLKTSKFDHKCECREGYSNLLNISSLACYRDCSLGTNCADLGITLSNSSSSPPSSSSLSDSSNSLPRDAVSPNYLVVLLLVFASIVMVGAAT